MLYEVITEPIHGRPPREISALGVAFVPQERNVFPSLTVRENLEMGALIPRARRTASDSLDEVLTLFPRLAERRAQLAGTLFV